MKFEYYVLREEDPYPPKDDVQKVLNHLGSDGWELVTVIWHEDGTRTFFFKKQKQ